jgi:hypothetical protein
MATAREVRFRVLYVAVGVVLTLVTIWVLAAVSPMWWAVIPGVLCLGWWYPGVQTLTARALGHDVSGDAYRSGPQG